MREKNENTFQETEAAFAFAVLLLNVLIILILCGGIWMLHSLIAQPDSPVMFLRDYTMSG